MVLSAAQHSQTMSIPPETYAFLLEHDYKYVREWVLTGELSTPIKNLLPLLEDNQELITAWVDHNERNRKMIRSRCGAYKSLIGLVAYCAQIDTP